MIGRIWRRAWLALLVLLQAGHAQHSGQWSPVQSWPVVSVNAILLPNGKVMFYSFEDDARLWDPATGGISDLARVGYNIFCSGHSYLGDGRLLVTGGHIQNGRGLNDASYYDPFNDRWTRLPDMNDGRWYPTSTTLADGDVLITSGSRSGGGVNELPQVWQVDSGSWRNLSAALLQLPLYPRQFLAPNGQVFVATSMSRYLNTTGTGRWTPVAARLGPGRDNYGSACLYADGRIMFSGGADPPLATAEVIDLAAPTPAWREVASMQYPRRQHNLTLLPDGTVLATGGSRGAGFDNVQAPVLPAELWDPETEQWQSLSSAARYRGYHSIALLLPDGRVLSAGGDYELNAEVFSPPYLFRGPRPTVTAAPGTVSYGESFHLTTPDGPEIDQVNWLRLGAVTHGFNMDQRINRLAFSPGDTGLTVVAPSDPNLCPPGIYMLFILSGQGVPSVGRMLRIGHDSAGADLPPTVRLAKPLDGMVAGAPAALTLNADAQDPDGAISKVEFYEGGMKLGEDLTPPFEFVWSDVPQGSYAFTARATDQTGLSATSAVVRVTVLSSPAASERSFVTGRTLGRLRADYTGWVGMQFTVGDNPVTVTALGRICVAGNAGAHGLRLVDAATGQDLAVAQVSMAGGTAGQFNYAALAAPVALQPRRSYILASHETAWTDRWCDLDTQVQTTPIASCDSPVYQLWSAWIKVGSPGRSYGPVSFLYQSGTPASVRVQASAHPPGAGTVNGAGDYTAGSMVTLQASAQPGYAFVHWLENGTPVSSQSEYTFVLTTARAVSALFTNLVATYSLTASPLPPEAGSTTGSGIYRAGEQATVAAIAEPGYSFLHWSENDQVLSATPLLTFVVGGPRTLYAHFQPAAPAGEPTEGVPLFNVLSTGKVRNDYTGWVGTQIRVGSDPLHVTALGRMTLAGNRDTHTVKLIDAATGQDLGQVELSMPGSVAGQFQYAPLTPPVLLNPGRLYYLVSQERLGGDTWHDYEGQVQTTAGTSCPGAVYSSGAGWVGVTLPNRGYGPLNLIHGGTGPNQPVRAVVRLTQPADRALFDLPAFIDLAAEVDPPEAAAQRVEFHAGANKIGEAAGPPFNAAWNVTVPGSYLVTATAVAADGGRDRSEPATVHVQSPALGPETNVIAHWRFDEGGGGHAIDSQGGLAGALMNGPAWMAGLSGGALGFDGVNDYLNVPHQPVLILGPAFSISLWFKPAQMLNASSGRKDLLKKHISYWLIMNYPLNDGKLVFVLNSGAPLVRSTTTSWQPERWYHAVATCDGTSMKLYVNGVLEGAVSSSLLPSPNTSSLQIGGNSDQNVFFPGAIDDVRIYRTVLDPAFVAALWQEFSE